MTVLEQWQTWPAWAFILFYLGVGALVYLSADLFNFLLNWLFPGKD